MINERNERTKQADALYSPRESRAHHAEKRRYDLRQTMRRLKRAGIVGPRTVRRNVARRILSGDVAFATCVYPDMSERNANERAERMSGRMYTHPYSYCHPEWS